MPPPFRIGLTGGIASGKSTVAQRFEAHGIAVIDADQAARAVVGSGSPGLARVVQRFGREVLRPDGTLDRGILRQRVFTDAAARRDLEGILHPLIRDEMERGAQGSAGPYLVMAIPLLVEGGAKDRVDRILVVDADEATQLRRVTARDGSSEAQARAILEAQTSRERRLAAADDVIRNEGSLAELGSQVDRLHEKYLALSRGT